MRGNDDDKEEEEEEEEEEEDGLNTLSKSNPCLKFI